MFATETSSAVFLSYASQDAEAARRIVESLRSAGVEVWFDQAELAGGDAWDAKIRGQIASCALFVPVISANTQARLEGYFRREWKQAAARTHDMAEEKTFLLPVVIDATRDAEAKVPPEFKAVQWTRLPNGESAEAFSARVARLLAPAPKGPGSARVSRAAAGVPPAASATPPPAPIKRPRRAVLVGVALAALVLLAVAATLALRRSPPPASVVTNAPAPASAAVQAPANDVQAVAVLPFANLSGDPGQEYFSDGLTEEILNALARERDLRVPGRTSSFSFKGKNAAPAEIAAALNVSRLVEGSVRKSGTKVRISVSLTRASDGFSEELGTFTEELTDIFALQDKVARVVVEKLTRRAAVRSVAVLTTNPEAYDAYLRGRAEQVMGIAGSYRSIPFFRRVVELDPQFTQGWISYAASLTRSYSSVIEQTPRLRAEAKQALSRALELAPDSPAAWIVKAAQARVIDNDFVECKRALDHAAQLGAPSAELRFEQSYFARETGDRDGWLRNLEEAAKLDPKNGDVQSQRSLYFMRLGDFSTADRLFAVFDWANSIARNRIYMRLSWRGPAAALALVDYYEQKKQENPDLRGNELLALIRADLLFQAGRVQESRTLAQQLTLRVSTEMRGFNQTNTLALRVLSQAGLHEQAQALAKAIQASTQAYLDEGDIGRQPRADLIRAQLILGERAEAVLLLKAWRKEVGKSVSAFVWYDYFATLAAGLFALAGLKTEAVEILERIERIGYNPEIGFAGRLDTNSDYANLRNEPRFQDLVARLAAHAAAQPDPVDP